MSHHREAAIAQIADGIAALTKAGDRDPELVKKVERKEIKPDPAHIAGLRI